LATRIRSRSIRHLTRPPQNEETNDDIDRNHDDATTTTNNNHDDNHSIRIRFRSGSVNATAVRIRLSRSGGPALGQLATIAQSAAQFFNPITRLLVEHPQVDDRTDLEVEPALEQRPFVLPLTLAKLVSAFIQNLILRIEKAT
jgi:hypothetical protein